MIGEAYMHGIMEGEAMKEYEEGRCQKVVFQIV